MKKTEVLVEKRGSVATGFVCLFVFYLQQVRKGKKLKLERTSPRKKQEELRAEVDRMNHVYPASCPSCGAKI